LNFLIYHKSLEVEIHMQTLLPPGNLLGTILPRIILVEDLCKPIEVGVNVIHIHQIRVGPSWMDSIVLFLKEDILPKNKSEADKI